MHYSFVSYCSPGAGEGAGVVVAVVKTRTVLCTVVTRLMDPTTVSVWSSSSSSLVTAGDTADGDGGSLGVADTETPASTI